MNKPQRTLASIRRIDRRPYYLICGYVLFAIGAVGMVLPVLPTTIFWIIAAICFARSSPAMYQKILANPKVGPTIEAFLTDGIISPKSKLIAVSGMALAGALVAVSSIDGLAKTLSFALIVFGAAYVLTRRSK